MHIAGLQKLTLLDYPGKVACTVFTAGCNMRCPFCHNALLVTGAGGADEYMPENEFFSFLKKRQGILEGVVLTGGEPLLQSGVTEFLAGIKEIGYSVKLDTNGTNPKLLKNLVRAGLADMVAMDIKSSPEGYAEATGLERPDMKSIGESIEFLLSGEVRCEFRTTVVKGLHTPESIRKAAEMIAGADAYFLQRYADSGNVISPDGLSAFSEEETRELLTAAREFVPNAELRGM